MADRDEDDEADRVVLTYSERINHARDSDGRYPFKVGDYRYPFKVGDYRIKEVKAALRSRTLTILLWEKGSADPNAKPSVKYERTGSKPVRDLAGNQARGETFADTFPLKAIFVSPAGNGSNSGSPRAPLQTIPAAIDLAADAGALDVYLAGGTYSGPIRVTSGLGIAGGFNQRFERISARPAIQGGKDPTTSQFVAVFAVDLAAPATLKRLEIRGPDATEPGKSSYGIAVRNADLTVMRSRIVAGEGADGADGADGQDAPLVNGTDGMNGAVGDPANEELFLCNATEHGEGGPGGTNPGAPSDTAGGGGGDGGEMDNSCGSFGCESCSGPAAIRAATARSSCTAFSVSVAWAGPGARISAWRTASAAQGFLAESRTGSKGSRAVEAFLPPGSGSPGRARQVESVKTEAVVVAAAAAATKGSIRAVPVAAAVVPAVQERSQVAAPARAAAVRSGSGLSIRRSLSLEARSWAAVQATAATAATEAEPERRPGRRRRRSVRGQRCRRTRWRRWSWGSWRRRWRRRRRHFHGHLSVRDCANRVGQHLRARDRRRRRVRRYQRSGRTRGRGQRPRWPAWPRWACSRDQLLRRAVGV